MHDTRVEQDSDASLEELPGISSELSATSNLELYSVNLNRKLYPKEVVHIAAHASLERKSTAKRILNFSEDSSSQTVASESPPGHLASSLGPLQDRRFPSINAYNVSQEGYVAGNPLRSPKATVSTQVLPTTTIQMKTNDTIVVKLDTCIRRTYNCMLLGLPLFYFARVTRIFKEVYLSADDLMKAIILDLAKQQFPERFLNSNAYSFVPNIP